MLSLDLSQHGARRGGEVKFVPWAVVPELRAVSSYAKQHPIETWNSPTAILYVGQDNLTDRDTVTDFAEKFGCSLQIYEDGAHWFHTEEQLAVLNDWIQTQC